MTGRVWADVCDVATIASSTSPSIPVRQCDIGEVLCCVCTSSQFSMLDRSADKSAPGPFVSIRVSRSPGGEQK